MQNTTPSHFAEELISTMHSTVAFLENELPQAVTILEQYVVSRRLPKGHLTGSPFEDVAHAIMILGSVMELRPASGIKRYGHDLMPIWAYSDDNPLQALLVRAEKLAALDSEDAEYFDSITGKSIDAMTLDDLAIISGRATGSIRNLAHSGEISTFKQEAVSDREGYPVTQKVFVPFKQARMWLMEKKAYEEPQFIDQEPDFEQLIRNYKSSFDGKQLPDFLRIRAKGDLEIYYAPFEYINKAARVVLCGITPGSAQAEVALNTYAEQLHKGANNQDALKAAKEAASFSGPMRNSLVEMLDHTGLHHTLGIDSCRALFNEARELVHYTSALRNPVFFRESNYTGNPLMLHEDILRTEIEMHLANEVQQFSNEVIYIPLGPKPAEALLYLVDKGFLKESQILTGLPHPSGANAERIAYFCGRKPKEALSSRTNAESLDAALASIRKKIDLLKGK